MLTFLARQLAPHASTLNVSDEDMARLVADGLFLTAVVNAAYAAQTTAKAWTATRQAARGGKSANLMVLPWSGIPASFPPSVAPGIEHRTRMLIRRIKSSSGYTESIGTSLGIVVSNYKREVGVPKLSVRLNTNQAELRFRKGDTHGARIFSRRGNETEFTFTAVDTRSPYVDKRPNLVLGQPEVRQYYIYLFLDDKLVGMQSQIVSITL